MRVTKDIREFIKNQIKLKQMHIWRTLKGKQKMNAKCMKRMQKKPKIRLPSLLKR